MQVALTKFLPNNVWRRAIAARRARYQTAQLDSIRRDFDEFCGQFHDFHQRWKSWGYAKDKLDALDRREDMRKVIARADEEFPEWGEALNHVRAMLASADAADFSRDGHEEHTLATE